VFEIKVPLNKIIKNFKMRSLAFVKLTEELMSDLLMAKKEQCEW
jgi:hypothetical protein